MGTDRRRMSDLRSNDSALADRHGVVLPFPSLTAESDADRERLLGLLYERYSGRLLAYASNYFSEDDAEDIVQRAFCQLWDAHLKDAQAGERVQWEGLLVQMVHFRILDQMRRRQTFRAMLKQVRRDMRTRFHRWMSPALVAEARDAEELIEEAMKRMSPRGREVFVLQFKADMTVKEIAESLGVGYETVKELLQRANRVLRDHAFRAGYAPDSDKEGNNG